MNRELTVELGNKYLNNTLIEKDVITLLQNYCKDKAVEMKKPWDTVSNAVDQAIILCLSANRWQNYFKQALSYYANKFNVIECYSQEITIKTPLGEQKQRKLLMYY